MVKPKKGNHRDAPPLLIPIINVKKTPIKLIKKINNDNFLVICGDKIEMKIKKNKDTQQ